MKSKIVLGLLVAWLIAAPAAMEHAGIKDRSGKGRRQRVVHVHVRRDGKASKGVVAQSASASVKPAFVAAGSDGRLAAYENLASWVDIYDEGPWDHPRATVLRMKELGAKTLYVQTTNYGAKRSLVFRDELDTMIDTAHRHGMRVVAWSVPSFAEREIDFKRAMKAINFRTDRGNAFDSFALDIEATVVRDIHTRNHRLEHMSRRLRKAVGPHYPLGAIVPDPLASRYWPDFPYGMVADYYDVFLPMSYFTYQAKGPRKVFHYTAANIRMIRNATKDHRQIPIHVIGGIASTAARDEVKGFVRAVRKHGAVGASLYDYPITSDGKWAAMRPVAGISDGKRGP